MSAPKAEAIGASYLGDSDRTRAASTVRRAWLIGGSPKPMAFCVMLSVHDSIWESTELTVIKRPRVTLCRLMDQ
jgi:hypothetical protein